MVMESFEGRIRRVFNNGAKWISDVYGTENKKYNGCFDTKEDVAQEAKKLSRVPQILVMITVKDGKIIRVEPL